MVKRAAWLSITPEPERELPEAVATLAAGRPASRGAVHAEASKIERLLLHGGQRRWLKYLHGVVELIDARAGCADLDVQRARSRARAVIANHHNLMLGLQEIGARPPRPPGLTAVDCARLAALELEESPR